MAKLKWKKDKSHGDVFDIRDGHSSFVIRKYNKNDRARMLIVNHYGHKMIIPFRFLTSAKKVAQLIHNG